MRGRAQLILGGGLLLLGVLLLAQSLGWLGDWAGSAWAIVFSVVGLVLLVTYVLDRSQWWLLIPGCIFLGLGGLIYLTARPVQIVPGAVAAALFLLFIGLPFWLIYLTRRDYWWALIPAAVMTFVALAVGLTAFTAADNLSGALIMWGIALAFWLIYLTQRDFWWAIIPAGVLTSVGLMILLGELLQGGWEWLAPGVFFAGLALTFAALYWLTGRKADMRWALWPALGCLIAALVFPVLGAIELAGPILLIAGGLIILYFVAFRGRR